MKKPLKSIIVSLGSMLLILISTTQISESCGFSYQAEDYRVSFFMPSTLGDDTFAPFYYTSEIINAAESGFDTDKQRNLKLWQAELGQTVALLDIDKVLYIADSDEVVNAFNEKLLDKTFGGNTFVKALLKPENKAILEYMVTAKQNEFINFADENPWGFGYDETETEAISYNEAAERAKVIQQIDGKLKTAKTAFLKQRYAYLQLVNYRYYNQKTKAVEIFEKYFNLKNNDLLTAWATFHIASCISNTAKANYYLSLAFDKCDSKKARCYLGFDKKAESATLGLAQNNLEKATIHAIVGMNNPARQLDLIQKVYALDNQNSNVKALIAREVNKIEDWLLTPKVTGMPQSIEGENDYFLGQYDYDYNDETGESTRKEIAKPQLYRNEMAWKTDYFNLKNYKKDLVYTREFRSFLEGLLIKEKNKTQQDFLKLAISHLYFLDNQPKQALAYNAKVSGRDIETKTQQEINTILLLPLTQNITSEATKTKLYQSLAWVQNNLESINNPLRTVSQLNLYLSKMYYKKGDVVTAAFLHQKSSFTGKQEWSGSDYYGSIAFFDRYGTLADAENAIILLNKKITTDFEKYMLKNYTEQEIAFAKLKSDEYYFGTWGIEENAKAQENMKSALIDLQGTIAFRQDNLKKALSYFKKLPADYWKENYEFLTYLAENPFVTGFVWGENDSEKGNVICNKIKIIEDLIILKEKAEKNKDAASYQALGNAYYNFTYWGNSWMMFSYGNYMDELENNETGYWTYSFYPNSDTYFNTYYGCDKAKSFYQKAFDAAKNGSNEQAKADLMLVYCAEMKQVAKRKTEGKSANMTDDYLKNWKIKYKNTNVYETLVMSCSATE
jgi:hypothetical protein